MKPALFAPIGASAVLVFAVPASALPQPWPVGGGGNTVSTLMGVGVAVARFAPAPHLAAGVAVGGAILAMSLLRCLHPPGGAVALAAVIGGPAAQAAGYAFALAPVAADAALLALAGWAFHRFSGHSYPRPPVPVAHHRTEPERVANQLARLRERRMNVAASLIASGTAVVQLSKSAAVAKSTIIRRFRCAA